MSWKLTVMWHDGWPGRMHHRDITRVTYHEEVLEQVARRRGVRSLVAMGAADGVYDPTAEEEDEEEAQDDSSSEFFTPEEGLRTLSALEAELRETPSLIPDADDRAEVLAEIAELQDQLRAGIGRDKRFRFLNV